MQRNDKKEILSIIYKIISNKKKSSINNHVYVYGFLKKFSRSQNNTHTHMRVHFTL
jgi:hypothetical protein